MKNKEWLKEEISKMSYVPAGLDESNSIISTNWVLNFVNQLEEPEQDIDAAHDLLAKITTLSQEDFDLYWNCINDGVAVSELKQEKVVVPQFVAYFIEEIKPNFNIRAVFTLQNNKHEQGQKWALDNPDVFARAWLDGFVVEEEKLYKVILPGVESLDRQMCMHEETKVIGFADDGYNSRKYSKDDKFIRLFTEQEIKAIDERYWAFAEEVPND